MWLTGRGLQLHELGGAHKIGTRRLMEQLEQRLSRDSAWQRLSCGCALMRAAAPYFISFCFLSWVTLNVTPIPNSQEFSPCVLSLISRTRVPSPPPHDATYKRKNQETARVLWITNSKICNPFTLRKNNRLFISHPLFRLHLHFLLSYRIGSALDL
jgi:hypothetical protein